VENFHKNFWWVRYPLSVFIKKEKLIEPGRRDHSENEIWKSALRLTNGFNYSFDGFSISEQRSTEFKSQRSAIRQKWWKVLRIFSGSEYP